MNQTASTSSGGANLLQVSIGDPVMLQQQQQQQAEMFAPSGSNLLGQQPQQQQLMLTQQNNHQVFDPQQQQFQAMVSATAATQMDTGSSQPQQQQYPQLHLSEDGGAVIMSSMDGGSGVQQQFLPQQQQQQQQQQQHPQASNKVLLVLPGGQMILTDLTDEQCGHLNIQVGSNSTSGQESGTGSNSAVQVMPGPQQLQPQQQQSQQQNQPDQQQSQVAPDTLHLSFPSSQPLGNDPQSHADGGDALPDDSDPCQNSSLGSTEEKSKSADTAEKDSNDGAVGTSPQKSSEAAPALSMPTLTDEDDQGAVVAENVKGKELAEDKGESAETETTTQNVSTRTY